jgi:hypothetical protein
VEPRDAERLEWHICKSRRLPPPQQLCRQFVRHQSLWVPVEVLTMWDIRYTTLQQKAGQLVITAPGGQKWGLERGQGNQLRRWQERCSCTRLQLLHEKVHAQGRHTAGF